MQIDELEKLKKVKEKSYKQEGFTIIELLVGINLGFFLIAILAAAYLFTVKFTSQTSKRHANTFEMTTLLNRLHDEMQSSDEFIVTRSDSITYLIIDKYNGSVINADTVLVSTNIILSKSLDSSFEIEGYEIKLVAEQGSIINQVSWNSNEHDFAFLNQSIQYSSSEIMSIELRLIKDSKNYKLVYMNQLFGIKSFKNMDSTNVE